MPELDRGLLLHPYDRFNRVFETRSAEDREAFFACFHPDAEIRDTFLPDGRVYSGLDGVREWLARAEDGFDSARFEVERQFLGGDAGVLAMQAHVRTERSRFHGRLTVVHALRFEDGVIRDAGVFTALDPALASVELGEAEEIWMPAPRFPGDCVQALGFALDTINARRWDDAVASVTPDVELVENALGVDSTVYHGRDGIRRWLETSLAMAETVVFEPRQVIAGREAACALTAVHTRTGGIDFDFEVGQAFRWRRGLSEFIGSFASLAAAAGAVGLERELGVVELYGLFNDGRYGEFRDTLHPEIVWEETFLPETGTYRGHTGIDEWFDAAGGAFSEVRLEVDRIAPVGEGLLVTHELRGRGASSGIETRQAVHHSLRLREGLVAYVGAFADEASARAALSSPSSSGEPSSAA
jgi:ketosteroid isomerase-like protein